MIMALGIQLKKYRGIKKHDEYGFCRLLQQSWKYQCPQNICDIIIHDSLIAGGDSCYVSNDLLTWKILRYTKHSAPRSRAGDEGGPLGAGLPEQASNHLKLLWSKAMVVSVEEKVPLDGIR